MRVTSKKQDDKQTQKHPMRNAVLWVIGSGELFLKYEGKVLRKISEEPPPPPPPCV
jgi:hypothetical protein